ncbi:hypothetical protein COD95_09330 [Bacillus thuringiensis]|uniref:hypothetical protein n=1 Tax=Bacillus thuringiensis TaxID=1428 RepID=UPI000BFBBF91|nr:hypothetical protein [Bacillus thuringiensis]PGW24551.1 hypothetical protein COD95_09330 [Bacillus thuringiensis]
MTQNDSFEKYNTKLVEHLETFFAGAQVYQDIVQEDEVKLSEINHVVFETGGFEKTGSVNYSQEVTVYYFSENREDLDLLQLSFMSSLGKTGHVCNKTSKGKMQKKDTEFFVDVITFELKRSVRLVC